MITPVRMFRKIQQYGRSMLEMLGVLAIVGLLSIGGLVAYRIAMNKYRANQVYKDVNGYGFVILEHIESLPDGEIGRYDFVPVTEYSIKAFNDTHSGGFFHIKVDDVPKGVCVEILNKEPPGITFYVNGNLYGVSGNSGNEDSGEGEGEGGGESQEVATVSAEDLCQEGDLNDISFYFKDSTSVQNLMEEQETNDDCAGACCNCSGTCIQDVLTSEVVCCPRSNQIVCGGGCYDPCENNTLVFNVDNCRCDCELADVKVYNEATGRCECPTDKPNYFDVLDGGVCCGNFQTVNQGECVDCFEIDGCKTYDEHTCECKACENAYRIITNGETGEQECEACTVVDGCSVYDGECQCTACAEEYRKIQDQNKCCPIVAACIQYDAETCACQLCKGNKLPVDGECVCTNNPSYCDAGEFCAYEHPVSNGDKGKGFCARLSAFGGQTKETSIQTGNLLTSHEWVRSTSGMTWWSAEAWCAAKGYEMASRNLLGCPSATGLCNTTGDYPVLQQEGWTYDARHWLEMQNTWNAYAIILKKGYGIAPDQRNARNYAFCRKTVDERCVEIDPNCGSYNSLCECTFCNSGYILGEDGKCRVGQCSPITNCMSYTADCQCFLCKKGYNFDDNGDCVETCRNNSSCTPSLQFCEFGSPFGQNDPGPSDCKNLATSPEIPSPVIAGGKEWIRSAYSMSWWSAVNWCKARGYNPVTLTVFQNGESTSGCGSGNGACYNTIAKAIRDNGDWTQNDKLFISTSDVDDPTTSGQQVKAFMAGDSKGPGGISNTDKNASGRYAFCWKNATN